MSYSSFKRVFLRIPIYSLNSLKDILKDTDTYEAKIKSSSELMEAIKRSSDSFYQKLVNQNFTNSIKSTTYNYLSRVATRSSPYDLFSGIASGSLEDKSISQFKQKYSIISRVNLDYLYSICQNYIYDKHQDLNIKYYPNPTIYLHENEFRYIQTTVDFDNHTRKSTLSSVISNEILIRILELAEKGVNYKYMLSLLISLEYDKIESEGFIKDMIQSNLLISDAIPSVDLGNHLKQITEALSLQLSNTDFFKELVSKRNILNSNKEKVDITEKIDLDIGNLQSEILNKDIVYKSSFEIKREISDQVLSILPYLQSISTKKVNKRLEKFRERFDFRYGEKKVLLLEALDPSIGIEYGNLKFDSSNRNELAQLFSFSEKGTNTASNIVNDLSYYIFNTSRSKSTVILDDFIKSLNTKKTSSHSDTISAIIELGYDKFGSQIINLKAIGGITASSLINRSSDYFDEAFKFANEVFNKEEEINKEKMCCELSFYPDNVYSDVLSRKASRRNRIVFQTKSNQNNDSTEIPLNDIYLSFYNGEFILNSKAHEREILVYNSNSYNYRGNSNSVISFLCDLQEQRTHNLDLMIRTDNFAYSNGFCPRLMIGNIIVSPKYWFLGDELLDLINREENFLDKKTVFLSIFNKKKIDTEFLMITNKGELYFNIKSEVSLSCLLDQFKKHREILLKETFFYDHTSKIEDVNGNLFSHEIILSYYKNGN